jgi:hypothetical protein
MTKYRICIALLTGLGFVALVCLSLNIPYASLFLFTLLVPGAILSGYMNPWANWNSSETLVFLAANVFVYSFLAFVLILRRTRTFQISQLKRVVILMVVPVTVPSGLACFSRLNPLLPLGMTELSSQESTLRQVLPLNNGGAGSPFHAQGSEHRILRVHGRVRRDRA